MTFSPIAIVGRGCILPGALDPASLWTRVLRRDDLTGPSTRAQWGLDPMAVCQDPLEPSASARGGYVTGFTPAWRADRFVLPAEQLQALPVGWQWLITAGRQALDEASIGLDGGARVGLVVGNLGYATRELADTAARRWCGDLEADHPAMAGQSGALYWTARALGLAGPRLSLDAACASGLYALQLACEALQRGRADVMLAAGLNAADDLFLHVGFTALSALSRSGRSAPLSALADGLLPAEGAAVVALKRLDDAVAAGDPIVAVVRGVGLSNDGRGPGLLAPATAGQQRAIRAAYAASGLRPADVAYLECHATGTEVGDREEILSVRAVFGDAHPLQLGSLKAQLGHLITASGTAGLVKLCGAFEHDTLPPAPQVSLEHPADALLDCTLALRGGAERWTPRRAPRLAAINAFGFGGCNAHAVLAGPEAADDLAKKPKRRAKGGEAARPPAPLALVACEIAVGAAADTSAILRVLLELDPPTRRIGDLDLAVQGLGFPPADLRHALPQQLLLLRTAEALRPHLEGLDRTRVGVFVGTEVDPAGARHGCRWRLDQMLGRHASRAERDAVAPPLVAAGVLGTMPNMPANRLNSLLDAGGPGFVVNDGAASGRQALAVAADAIARGELDAALVGAVDASGGAFGDDPSRADAVVLLLVMHADLAGNRDVIARLERSATGEADRVPTLPWAHSGAAHDLLQLAVAALCCRHALSPERPALPWVDAHRLVRVHGWDLRAPRVQGLAEDAPALAAPPAAPPAGAAGRLAWVFTGAAAAYPGAGLPLLRAFPELVDDLRAMAPRLTATLPALLGKDALSLIEQLQLATLVSQAQARLLRRMGLAPDAVVGLSSGETNSLLATGAWTDADDLFEDVARSGMYDRYLAGDYETLRQAWELTADETTSWRCYRVIHPVAALREAIAARPRVRLLIVHHAHDAVIGGDDAACRSLLADLGAQAVPIEHDLLVHCPELDPFAATWYRVHYRATAAPSGVLVYANAIHGAYVPSAETCAEMITGQACATVEFDRTIVQAWEDGARTFVELGPRQACTAWIRAILAGRPHVACAVDGARGTLGDVAAALSAVATAGHPVDRSAWDARVGALRVIAPAPAAPPTGRVRLPGHRALPTFHDARPAVLALPPAPQRAPVLPGRLRPVAVPGGEARPVAHASFAETGFDDVPFAEVADTVHLPAALLALAHCQDALLETQALAIEHLVGSGDVVDASWAPWGVEASPEATPVAPPAPGVEGPPAPAAGAPSPTPAARPLVFTREQLEVHAGGRISTIFGPQFAVQDDYRRQVRMPRPPLLLADRVTGMEGEAASMKTGRVWTETDVRPDAWYLHHGRMPAGIVIESGQADLFLVSWLGIDLLNRGERVYRLLGCELTFHGRLPEIGETLRYAIAIDGHARHGDVGLFFFHYDCRSGDTLRLSVRRGQAGFFTDAELAESAGVLWDPAEDVPPADAPNAGPREGITPKAQYDADAVRAFAAGDPLTAFGPAFLRTGSHTRTPRIPAGRLQLFERVDELDLAGGPWGRGYMRATLPIAPDQWFFPGHFMNDPCMPGTLMFEGCLQTMAFYLAALGYTIDRDGWSFEPESERPYLLRCRGQVTPQSQTLTYEVFVAELHDGPEPLLVADLMCTVDGLRAFHCRRMALRLRPDFPLSAYDLAQVAPDREPVAEIDGFRYGQASLLACATGHPVAAFGQLYAALPPARRVPRLPAPPYHFISRVTALSHSPGQMQAGAIVETAYDLPPDAWYFAAHPTGQMPVAVLIEVALQPCGWLASYVGCAVREPDEVFFRNLDGKGVLHRAVRPEDGGVRVRSRLRSISRAGGMTLVSFDVVCTADATGDTVYELATTFGFFPKAALEGQAGLPAEPADLALAQATSDVDLLAGLSDAARACLPRPPLTMCERVTHRTVDAGGRAMLRGEKRVQPSEWFLKAHFFQDPVQPGSLGVEALVQLLQAHLLLEGAADAFPDGVFADLVAPDAAIWQFRGQVLPEASVAAFTLTAQPIQKRADGWTVTAEGSLWVDGRRIYHVRALTVSMAPGPPGGRARPVRLDPAAQPWWKDHCPTYTVPVLPGMAVLSIAMGAAPEVVGVDDLVLRRWLVLDRAREIALARDGDRVRLTEDGRPLAEASLCRTAETSAPPPMAPLPASAPALEDPYASGAMFHGPAYHRVIEGRRDATGADLWLRVDPTADGRERVPHILLDAGLHGVPHDALETWFPGLPAGQIGYPAIVERFRLFGVPPRDGRCEVRVRPDGFHDPGRRLPRLRLHFLSGDRLWAELVLAEACLPATRLGRLSGRDRRAFLREGGFVPGARLSDETAGTSTLDQPTLATADWLPGTVDALYGLAPGIAPGARLAAVVAREHAAARLRVHPRTLGVDADGRVHSGVLPLLDYRVRVEGDARRASATDAAPPALDVPAVRAWWDRREWQSDAPGLQALFLAACRHFVRGVRLAAPADLAVLRDAPLLLLANHQVAVESVLAGMALPPVLGRPLVTLAKQEHRDTWVGRLAMGLNDPRHGPAIVYVDRERQQEMLERLGELGAIVRSGRRSLMVHVEGTRALAGGQPVTTISGVWADLAVRAGLTIVPLRFCGGLPHAGVGARLEFPFGLGAQELVLGRPIAPETLSGLHIGARRDRILEGLATLEAFDPEPLPDPAFAARVADARDRWGLDELRAVFLLLQAEAAGWALDAAGLPAEAVERQADDDPFWAWFGSARERPAR